VVEEPGGKVEPAFGDVVLHELLELLDRHLARGDGEPARDGHAAERLVARGWLGLARRRAHTELDWSVDLHEGLPLAVDKPAPPAWLLELGQPGVGGLELLLLAPLPEGPPDRSVDAGIGVVAIALEEPADQVLALARREALGAVGPQGQDQR